MLTLLSSYAVRIGTPTREGAGEPQRRPGLGRSSPAHGLGRVAELGSVPRGLAKVIAECLAQLDEPRREALWVAAQLGEGSLEDVSCLVSRPSALAIHRGPPGSFGQGLVRDMVHAQLDCLAIPEPGAPRWSRVLEHPSRTRKLGPRRASGARGWDGTSGVDPSVSAPKGKALRGPLARLAWNRMTHQASFATQSFSSCVQECSGQPDPGRCALFSSIAAEPPGWSSRGPGTERLGRGSYCSSRIHLGAG